MDILDEVLKTLRLNANVFLHAQFCENWVVNIEALNYKVCFHVIARGDCWLHAADSSEPRALHAGDLLICPRNARHLITNSPKHPADDVPRNTPKISDGSTPSTSLICGYCEFLQYYWNPILEALPEYLVIPNVDSSSSRLAAIINLMTIETEAGDVGSNAVINRLSDILFIEAIRAYIHSHEDNRGYIAALKEPRLSKALISFHKQPTQNWTVQSLSEAAGMSRSGFAELFKNIVSMSPMEYVTGWRMQYAYDLLTSSTKSVTQIAEECSYQSESAFRKVFKRQFDIGPGAVRREARSH